MLSMFERGETSPLIESRVKLIWTLAISLLLTISLSLYPVWKHTTSLNPSPSSTFPFTQNQKEIRSWLLNYPDLSQAQNRHLAFRDLTRILQQHKDAAQEIEKKVLLNRKSSLERLAVTVGVLSSQGTPQAQRALSNSLSAFHKDIEKVMLVLPQIILLEEPQNFLFDALQTFIHKNQNLLLRENAELTLAGLLQQAKRTNSLLAKRITLWLEGKRTASLKNSQTLCAFLDLLGNTGDETFLADILQATTHENAEIRSRAAFALRLFRKEQVVKTLKSLTVDQNLEVRTKATEALSYFYTNSSL